MFMQNFNQTYFMVNPNDRNLIIQQIINKEIESECVSGRQQNWWLKKHHPENEIPTNIYLLGNGTIKELYDKYINKHGYMEQKEFNNYTRELIKQQIMVGL
jgi:hypothetical protein